MHCGHGGPTLEAMRDAANVRIAPLTHHDDHVAAALLLADVWGTPPASSPVPADLLVALTHSGACVLGAFSPSGTVVGVTVGVAGKPQSECIHSLIAGVTSPETGHGVGRALKFAQRAWAIERGARRILWTFDPLIRRNAHFNLNILGTRVLEFIPDYYPPLHDTVNKGDQPDRFCVEWRLDEALPTTAEDTDAHSHDWPLALAETLDEKPLVLELPAADTVGVWIPKDIEGMRRIDVGLALEWRMAARRVLKTLFDDGYRPIWIGADGVYHLSRKKS